MERDRDTSKPTATNNGAGSGLSRSLHHRRVFRLSDFLRRRLLVSCPINKCGFSAQEKGCGKARSAGNTLPYCQGMQRGHSPSPARPSGVGTIADRHSCEGAPRAFWLRAPLQPLAICPIFPADCALPSAIVPTLNHTYLWDRTLVLRQTKNEVSARPQAPRCKARPAGNTWPYFQGPQRSPQPKGARGTLARMSMGACGRADTSFLV